MTEKKVDVTITKFNRFIETCVIGNGALLTKTTDLFTKGNLSITAEFLEEVHKYNKGINEKNKNNENKEITIGIDEIFSKKVFAKKEFENFSDNVVSIVEILLHFHWLMYLGSDKLNKKKYDNYIDNISEDNKSVIDYFYTKHNVYWAIGQTLSGFMIGVMCFIVKLILGFKSENNPDFKKFFIDNFNKELKWKNGDKVDACSSITNIILYMCDDNTYLPIPAEDTKVKILAGFGEFSEGGNLCSIREIIWKNFPVLKDDKAPFWNSYIRPIWDTTLVNEDSDKLSDATLLKYKKAMVLYGPPGTGKSYQARRIAEDIIAQKMMEKGLEYYMKGVANYDVFKKHIHPLQMHPNYTYEDFICGKTIVENGIVPQKGWLMRLIDDIEKKREGKEEYSELPHIVILDEINRVDISRVFGELFTAMESSYREEGVELPVSELANEKWRLRVPEDLYFIGTMNMIDFSLEQIDFALRRRFLWKESTYDEKRLIEILYQNTQNLIKDEKVEGNVKDIIREAPVPDDYVKNCTNLNNIITNKDGLGESYKIGHAFFAEIIDIFRSIPDWTKARKILWQISICPTLEAYCGTMDYSVKDKFIEKCKSVFLPIETKEV